jgi:hypothetical protein
MNMNRIVRRHYPASRLPNDLRGQIDPSHEVTVTVTDETPSYAGRDLSEIFERNAHRKLSEAEILAFLKAERDSWNG